MMQIRDRDSTRRLALDLMIGAAGLVIALAGFFQQEFAFLMVGA